MHLLQGIHIFLSINVIEWISLTPQSPCQSIDSQICMVFCRNRPYDHGWGCSGFHRCCCSANRNLRRNCHDRRALRRTHARRGTSRDSRRRARCSCLDYSHHIRAHERTSEKQREYYRKVLDINPRKQLPLCAKNHYHQQHLSHYK